MDEETREREMNRLIEEQRQQVERDRVVMSATYAKNQELLRLEQEKIESGERAEVEKWRMDEKTRERDV